MPVFTNEDKKLREKYKAELKKQHSNNNTSTNVKAETITTTTQPIQKDNNIQSIVEYIGIGLLIVVVCICVSYFINKKILKKKHNENMKKERLLEFIKYLNIGQNEFLKNVGLSKIYNNKKKITSKMIINIAKVYPQLNIEWLLFAKGEMLNRE
jgi:hypothetical protein